VEEAVVNQVVHEPRPADVQQGRVPRGRGHLHVVLVQVHHDDHRLDAALVYRDVDERVVRRQQVDDVGDPCNCTNRVRDGVLEQLVDEAVHIFCLAKSKK
jgi:hypothetical protein